MSDARSSGSDGGAEVPPAAETAPVLPIDPLHDTPPEGMKKISSRPPAADAGTLPELPVTLEVLYARQSHQITVMETLVAAVDRMDRDAAARDTEWAKSLAALHAEREALERIAKQQYESAMALVTARGIQAVVPPMSKLIALAAGWAIGCFGGSFAAMWVWLTLYGPAWLAHGPLSR